MPWMRWQCSNTNYRNNCLFCFPVGVLNVCLCISSFPIRSLPERNRGVRADADGGSERYWQLNSDRQMVIVVCSSLRREFSSWWAFCSARANKIEELGSYFSQPSVIFSSFFSSPAPALPFAAWLNPDNVTHVLVTKSNQCRVLRQWPAKNIAGLSLSLALLFSCSPSSSLSPSTRLFSLFLFCMS